MIEHSFNNIAIGIAFSPKLQANLYEAARLAQSFNATLSMIHVGEESVEKREKITNYLAEFSKKNLKYSIVFKTGNLVEVMMQYLKTYQIDLLVLGALQKEHFFNYSLGSISRKIARLAPCSVLLLIKPSVERVVCQHIVVNGLKSENTPMTILYAFYMANKLNSKRITIVEEINKSTLSIKVKDDATLRKANLQREKLRRKENARVDKILEEIPEDYKSKVKVEKQPIFGKRGYSIGHYAQISRADLLVMNAPEKANFWNRLFPNDIEYILKELPTDVLIIK